MTLRDREGLIARIRQIRRADQARGEAGLTGGEPGPGGESLESAAAGSLEARMTHLEQLVEGLQDSVHRETTRTRKRIEELEARTDPTELTRALSADARERGLAP